MEGLNKDDPCCIEYNVWYKNILGDKFMIHHNSHKDSLFVTIIIDDIRTTNVFERQHIEQKRMG